MLRLDHLAKLRLAGDVRLLEAVGWEHVRRREHRPLAENANAGVGEHRLVAFGLLGLLTATHGLAPLPALHEVRVVDPAGSRKEPRALLDGKGAEEATVGRDGLERLGRLFEPFCGLICHGARVAARRSIKGMS